MKRTNLLSGAMLALSALTASMGWAADKPVIGLVMKSLANPFYKTLVDGAQAYEAERGVFVLKAVGMQSETDVDTQLTAIESMITQQVDAIITIPGDSRALVPPLKRALDADIQVIDMLAPLDPKAMRDVGIDIGYYGPDDRAATKLVGDALAKKLGPGRKDALDERWCHDKAFMAKTRKLAIQAIARWAGPIAKAKARVTSGELVDKLAHRISTVGDFAVVTQLSLAAASESPKAIFSLLTSKPT
ncbi:substrate-binding domain-containing protein [Brucella intermedia]|uniref:substrate-binding domain-containing protein n=1 Tax=Brucella intermedia TaxID=94625 RepID=UPI0020004BD7|nr:substrate-binding domain-containing protein [Brucella intermedia]